MGSSSGSSSNTTSGTSKNWIVRILQIVCSFAVRKTITYLSPHSLSDSARLKNHLVDSKSSTYLLYPLVFPKVEEVMYDSDDEFETHGLSMADYFGTENVDTRYAAHVVKSKGKNVCYRSLVAVVSHRCFLGELL